MSYIAIKTQYCRTMCIVGSEGRDKLFSRDYHCAIVRKNKEIPMLIGALFGICKILQTIKSKLSIGDS